MAFSLAAALGDGAGMMSPILAEAASAAGRPWASGTARSSRLHHTAQGHRPSVSLGRSRAAGESAQRRGRRTSQAHLDASLLRTASGRAGRHESAPLLLLAGLQPAQLVALASRGNGRPASLPTRARAQTALPCARASL
eukprot:CAMPEP_0195611064 /NCGR_PEP_ID=MMETSP0815-20121206/10141_1 /TAXON_ID=97485 /ORGANISM="Prymnesium parvum, Strain Texoma1" /LENGTH=138 /DNA_ID=CAMNT_0040751091 /DNA_START=286 /DNA_END=699 /DNA_ORIENTATION=-